ncbi:putative PEP-binding protein, partial [Escherichia sp. HC-CC]
EFYVGRLTEGIATLGAAFYPKRVIVRLSDFKSNEYANLVGGERYEPDEENPMLGQQGVGRDFTHHDDFQPVLATFQPLTRQFFEYFDGFSIGSNDMTQLALGLDRDSG